MAAFNSPEAAEYAMLDQIEAMLAGQSGEVGLKTRGSQIPDRA
jgi:hypothetical protein